MKQTINQFRINCLLVISVTFLYLVFVVSKSSAFETYAKSAIVIDNLTNTIILRKNDTDEIPPASMSKLMTLYMVFEALQEQRISLTDRIKVSKKASKKGGSKMFLNEGQLVSIEELLRGIIIHSGNDACIAIAEALSGTEEEFARDMTRKGQLIGLKNSVFTNSTGWPDDKHYMTAEDLVYLATLIINDFPEYYKYFSEIDFTWNNIPQQNRNSLLNKGLGADGLKTGHTEKAGYGLVGSAKRGNRRVTFVITGLDSSAERANEGEKLLTWAFRDFKAKRIANKGQVIGTIPTWLAEKDDVQVAVAEDVFILSSNNTDDFLETYLELKTPMRAPFGPGELSTASLIVKYKSNDQRILVKKYPLVTTEGSMEGGFVTRLKAASIIVLTYLKNLVL